jgi:CoA:oxalate CoA-transferase
MTATPTLSGIRVLDLGRVHSGPFCSRILADLGAEVIKIEPPHGDDSRQFGPFYNGTSGDYRLLNRNKYGITLDLKTDPGRDTLRELLLRSDVLVENFRPGVLARLVMPVEEMLELNPRLVVVSISGYGHSGPRRHAPAYDLIVQAASGLISITGPEDGPGVRVGVSIGDIVPGLYGAIGALAALTERTRTGRGQHVDVAMFDSLVSILENAAMQFLIEGNDPVPAGRHHPSSAPFGLFDTQDGAVAIAALNDVQFRKLLTALGREELTADPRFASDSLRGANRHELAAELETVLKQLPASQALAILTEAGVPCGPVNSLASAFADPQTEARGMVITEADGFRTLAAGVRTANSVPVLRSAPGLGQDNDRLAGWLAEQPRV